MKTALKHAQIFFLLGSLLASSLAHSAPEDCNLYLQNQFKELYIELQKSLNYEKQDAALVNGKVVLKPHREGMPYGGKVFEEALFVEYQNALKKVGKLYQKIKFDDKGDQANGPKSNPVIASFFKSIEGNPSHAEVLKKYRAEEVLDALQKESQKRFEKNANYLFVLDDNDKYLLGKLIIHAKDRMANVAYFNKHHTRTRFFTAEYLKEVQEAPLNRLLGTLKDSEIRKDSRIDLQKNPHPDLIADLVSPQDVVKSAVAENLNNLAQWMKKNIQCLPILKEKAFQKTIQPYIQNCNYHYFLDTLSADNVNNLEAILHFINANEKFLSNPAPLAETALDESKLDSYIRRTFESVAKEVRCTRTESQVVIGNLPAPHLRQTPLFNCSLPNNKKLPPELCKSYYTFIPDPLGRGEELVPTKTTPKGLKLTVPEGTSSCANIPLPTEKERCEAGLCEGVESSKERFKDDSKDGAKNSSKNDSKDDAKNSSKNDSKDGAKNSSKNDSKDDAKNSSKEHFKDDLNNSYKDSSKDGANNSSKDDSKDGAKNSSKNDSKDNSKNGSKDNTEKNSNNKSDPNLSPIGPNSLRERSLETNLRVAPPSQDEEKPQEQVVQKPNANTKGQPSLTPLAPSSTSTETPAKNAGPGGDPSSKKLTLVVERKPPPYPRKKPDNSPANFDQEHSSLFHEGPTVPPSNISAPKAPPTALSPENKTTKGPLAVPEQTLKESSHPPQATEDLPPQKLEEKSTEPSKVPTEENPSATAPKGDKEKQDKSAKEKEECTKKYEEWLKETTNTLNEKLLDPNYRPEKWNEKECRPEKPKKEGDEDDDFEDREDNFQDEFMRNRRFMQPKMPPQRFNPIRVPTRQPYIMPGMP